MVSIVFTPFGDFIGEFVKEHWELKEPFRLMYSAPSSGKMTVSVVPTGIPALNLSNCQFAYGEAPEDLKRAYLSSKTGLTFASSVNDKAVVELSEFLKKSRGTEG